MRTKRGADKLARRLAAGGIKCAALHADRTQSERSAAVEGFKSGRFSALIATDIAARGIDIEGIGHVVNYEVPPSVDAYVHRVGRTGRAEAVGTAVTLVAPEELAALRAIEKITERHIRRRPRRALMRRYAAGDRVVQAQYGAGTIVDVNEHHTVIEFDEHGTRRFSTRIVVLETSNTPAPARKAKTRAKKKAAAPQS